MAASLNKVMLIGNLTRDPELRYTASNQPVTSFSVATNRTYVDKSGEKKQEVSYVRIVVWARRAEVCNEYLRKGSPVFVEGRLQSRSWEAQDGSKRSTIEVVAENVQFLGRGRGESSEAPAPPSVEEGADAIFEEPRAAGKRPGSPGGVDSELQPDDEIPF